MRQHYKVLLTTFIIFSLFVGLLLLHSTDVAETRSHSDPIREEGEDKPKPKCEPGNCPTCPNAIMDRYGQQNIPQVQLPDCSVLPTCPLTNCEPWNSDRSECVPRGPKPICPNPHPKRIGSECVPRGERPTCPNMDLTPRCPIDAAKERRN